MIQWFDFSFSMLLEALFPVTWRRAFLLTGQGQAAYLAYLNCGWLFSCPHLKIGRAHV